MSVIDHKCPTCNANLPYNPTTGKWDCEYCGNSFTLQELTEIQNKNTSTVQELDVYLCPDCGAKVVADENTSATFCVFCGNTNIIRERLTDEFEPDEIIPFKIDKKTVEKIYRKSVNKKIFLPNKFKKNSTIKKITGIYVPFWLFNCEGVSTLITIAKNVSSYVSNSYKYITTKEYQVLRQANFEFERIPVDGLIKIENDLISSLEPFDYNSIEKFNMSYLSGFLAEKYDIDKNIAFKEAEDRLKNTLKVKMKNVIESYDSIENDEPKITNHIKIAEYALLPIWFLNVHYKNKTYTCAVNGQTGKFIGDYPISKVKIVICFLFSFIFSLIAYFGIMELCSLNYIDMTLEIMPLSLLIIPIITFLLLIYSIVKINWLQYKIKKSKEKNINEKNLYNEKKEKYKKSFEIYAKLIRIEGFAFIIIFYIVIVGLENLITGLLLTLSPVIVVWLIVKVHGELNKIKNKKDK